MFLQLKNSEGNCISENFYWLAANDDFTALNKLSAVSLAVKVMAGAKRNTRIYKIKLNNPSETIAFFVNPSVRKGKDGGEILPSFWSDNYFSLLPGQSKDVEVESANSR